MLIKYILIKSIRYLKLLTLKIKMKPVLTALCAVPSVAIVCALFLFARPVAASAGLDAADMRNAVDAAARAEGTAPGDFELTDQDGVRFRLMDYFKGSKPHKPLVVSFIYASCPHVCPAVTAEVKKAAVDARERLGDRFNVLSISIDPQRDTPKRLKAYGLGFTRDFGLMRFAAPAQKDVKALTGKFGFFFAAKDDGSFDHIDMASVMKSDGTIYKQVYSIRTDGSGIKQRLDELITGKPAVSSASIVDKIRFFCYKYDPYSNKYVIDYPVLVSIFLQTAVFAVIIGLVWGKKIKAFFRRNLRGK